VRSVRRLPRTSLVERLDALAAAAEDAEGRLSPELVSHARAVVSRAGNRRRLSAEHTVVALAGSTGSGKSSLFNAIAGLDLARVGVRRPTTAEPLACTWGVQGVAPLLDWLGIPRHHQVPKESLLDSGEQDGLDGLVLLDMPDHDSTDLSHRLQVDRLVKFVDLLVWVVDPQKYADAALHERYLRPMAGHSAVTVVVLNHIDTLTPVDTKACVDDLRRLLVRDGFYEVRIVATSAVTGAGMDEFRDMLRDAVERRKASDDRLTADLGEAADKLLEETGRGEPAGITDADRERLVDALSEAAGVEVVAGAVGRAYRYRASRAGGWTVGRWLSRLRPNPLRRLGVPKEDVDPEQLRTAAPEPTPAQRAQADAAVRVLADAAAANGPAPWVASIRAIAADAAERLPGALDEALSAVDLGVGRPPRWWAVARAAQWFLTAAAAAGAAWLLAQVVADVPALAVGGQLLPALLLGGGAVLGVVVGVVTSLTARTGAYRRTVEVRRRLREAVASTAEDVVVAPVTAEVDRLESFRNAAFLARG